MTELQLPSLSAVSLSVFSLSAPSLNVRVKIYLKRPFIFLTQTKTIHYSNTQSLNSDDDYYKFVDLINANELEYDQIHGFKNILVNDFIEIKIKIIVLQYTLQIMTITLVIKNITMITKQIMSNV